MLNRFRPSIRLFLFFMLWLMSAPLYAAPDGDAILRDVIRRGDAAAAAYDPNAPLQAASEFSAMYFERFEALELDLGVRSARLKNELEIGFSTLNGNAMRGMPKERVESSWQKLREGLVEARALYGGASDDMASVSGIFLKSLAILLREGVEAILVIGALAAWLRRSGAADKVWVIHAGAAFAIPLSLLTGWALASFLQSAGAPRAAVEGITLVAASAMLCYVSCWLFSKREAKRWEEWIASQIDAALSRGSLWALSGAACLAVYREGAETVLFYQALSASIDAESPEQQLALWAGLAASAVLLLLAYFLMRYATLRLPFRFFFGATSALLYFLAIIFLGQAIIELQAAGWIAGIDLPGFPSVHWLGIAPSAQSLGAQITLLLLPLVWLMFHRFGKSRRLIPVTK